MRFDNRSDAPYTLDEFFEYTLETLLQFKKQRAAAKKRRGQKKSLLTKEPRTKAQWFGDFLSWLVEREEVELPRTHRLLEKLERIKKRKAERADEEDEEV